MIVENKTSLPKLTEESKGRQAQIELFRKRMLQWANPVEFVNNMYACHPGERNLGYIEAVFGA